MAIRDKINNDREKNIEEILNRGAPVHSDFKKEEKKQEDIKWRSICLRIPSPLEDMIDNALKKRFSITKSAWILEAIREKGERDITIK